MGTSSITLSCSTLSLKAKNDVGGLFLFVGRAVNATLPLKRVRILLTQNMHTRIIVEGEMTQLLRSGHTGIVSLPSESMVSWSNGKFIPFPTRANRGQMQVADLTPIFCTSETYRLVSHSIHAKLYKGVDIRELTPTI